MYPQSSIKGWHTDEKMRDTNIMFCHNHQIMVYFRPRVLHVPPSSAVFFFHLSSLLCFSSLNLPPSDWFNAHLTKEDFYSEVLKKQHSRQDNIFCSLFLQSTDAFTFVRVTGYVPHRAYHLQYYMFITWLPYQEVRVVVELQVTRLASHSVTTLDSLLHPRTFSSRLCGDKTGCF